MSEDQLSNLSLQDLYSPNSLCFGCGPKNDRGLKIKSYPSDSNVVADWEPEPFHVAFADFASGGIISVLLDCHGNWTAAYSLMKSRNADRPPGTVTAQYTVKFVRPTPLKSTLHLTAWAAEIRGSTAKVSGKVEVDGVLTATMDGTFVAVKEDHPAFHRWR